MKLVIDGRMWCSSGIGVYLREIVKLRPASENECSIITGDASSITDVKLNIIKSRPKVYSLKEHFDIAWRALDYDVLWVPHYNVPLLRLRSTVVTVHDCAHIDLVSVFSPFHRAYAWILLQYIGFISARIFCVSHFTAQRIGTICPNSKSKIRVVHNGVDRAWFSIKRECKRDVVLKLICIGNIKPHKNFSRLWEAVNQFNGRVCLEVYGKFSGFRIGVGREKMDMAARSGNIRFRGEVSDFELKEAFASADALIVPSLYEGFGLPVVEAMACRCPVLLSDIPVFREICGGYSFTESQEGCGIFFDPLEVNKIREAITIFMQLSGEAKQVMVSNALRRAEKYSWEVAAENVFREISFVGENRVI
jgi:glycosyltransferase involved in cell wall biosynthesis